MSLSAHMSNGVVVRPLLLIAAHMNVVVAMSAIRQAVDQPRIAVERENDRLVFCEQRVEVVVVQPVRMLARRLEAHQVDDIDDAHFEFGRVLAEEFDGGERLERRHVAAAGHHHVGLAAAVVLAHSQMPRPVVQCLIA